jgi:hypothetical protein
MLIYTSDRCNRQDVRQRGRNISEKLPPQRNTRQAHVSSPGKRHHLADSQPCLAKPCILGLFTTADISSEVPSPDREPLSSKSIKCSRHSDILVVGEGIFLNQKAAAGGSKSLKEHDPAIWQDLVSRALLYRVYPDFDPPTGYSGTALYANGLREDGTEGPGIVGFQSFV